MKKYLIPLLFTLSFCSFFCTTSFAQRSVIANDSLVLIDIYQSTNGRVWANPWQLNQRVSTWAGVTIENQRVVSLNFNARGLSG